MAASDMEMLTCEFARNIQKLEPATPREQLQKRGQPESTQAALNSKLRKERAVEVWIGNVAKLTDLVLHDDAPRTELVVYSQID